MLVSRTPLRISFFGGGTDLESFYSKEDGQVLSTSIDKYIYVAAKRQLPLVDYKYRIAWSQSEFKNRIEDIEHPIVREALKYLNIDFPTEITSIADIPAKTGLGSSGTFSVGLIHALYALKNEMVTKEHLAYLASKIEMEKLKRNGGKQDQYAAAFGNMNTYTFKKDGTVNVEPVFFSEKTRENLERSLMLFYTKIQRDASQVLKSYAPEEEGQFERLQKMKAFVPLAREILSKDKDLQEFGKLLHQSWQLKKELTIKISNPTIDQYYEKALKAGAIGGKLLGAGGGGFLLLFVEQDQQEKVRSALSDLIQVPFKFDVPGTRITYYDTGPY